MKNVLIKIGLFISSFIFFCGNVIFIKWASAKIDGEPMCLCNFNFDYLMLSSLISATFFTLIIFYWKYRKNKKENIV